MKYFKIILIFFTVTSLQAQWITALSAYSAYDDNIFSSYKNQSDTYLAPRLMVSNIMENSEWYLSNDFLQFSENSHYNYSQHSLGIDFFPEQRFAGFVIDYGASMSLRLNQDDYIYRNYTELKGTASAKKYTAANMLTKAGISLSSKKFPDEYDWNLGWDHKEISLFAQHNIFFQTGTTFRAGFQGLVRNFDAYASFIDGYYLTGELPSLYQGILNLRLAQSINPQMGGYTEYLFRYNPSESNPYEPEIMSFSPIDDYFGYGEQSWKTNLKYKIIPSLSLSTTFWIYEKSYKNRPIYEYNFETESFNLDEEDYYVPTGLTRDDSGYQVNVGLNYHMSHLFKKASTLSLRLDYDLQSNQSNDDYFDYKKQTFSLQLGWNFQK